MTTSNLQYSCEKCGSSNNTLQIQIGPANAWICSDCLYGGDSERMNQTKGEITQNNPMRMI